MVFNSTRYKRFLGSLGTVALLQASIWGGVGCNKDSTQPPPAAATEEQADVTLSISDLSLPLSTGGASRRASGPSARSLDERSVGALVAYKFSDVSRIVVKITDKETGKPRYINFDLTKDANGVWSGIFKFLPKNKPLTFEAQAFKGSDRIFAGITEKTLTDNNSTITITLAPENDGDDISLPRIPRIAIPAEFISGQQDNISFSVEADTGEVLTYEIKPVNSGVDSGTVFPSNGTITLISMAGTFVTQYAPPTVQTTTDFEFQVAVRNADGHVVTTTFKTKVKPPGQTDGVKNTIVNVLFNPVINSITAGRVVGSNNVIFEASVSDDSDPSTLSYEWSFSKDGSFEPVPSFTDQARVTTLQNYTEPAAGRIELKVEDNNGGTTTLAYPLKPNQFPADIIKPVDSTTGINTIRNGGQHTCVQINNGEVRCWGYGRYGQLGYGSSINVGDTADTLPYTRGPVDIVGKAAKLATGGDHTCVVMNDGAVRCWGRNDKGQLGYATTENVGTGEPVWNYGFVNLEGNAVKIAAGWEHTCALMDTGKVRCWGFGLYGQLGYGKKDNLGDNEQPWKEGDVNLGSGIVVDIVTGWYHTCALMDTGKVRCWGYNGHGELGLGSGGHIGDDEVPGSVSEINLGGSAMQITAGGHHTCALLRDTGFIRCWGLNNYGQLGYGNTATNYYRPVDLGDVNTNNIKALQVTAGNYHTCALLSTGGVKCWGRGELGQLGLGQRISYSTTPNNQAYVNLGGATAYQVSAGGEHTCALLSTGKAWCWGYNNTGQLGYGHKSNIGYDNLPSAGGDIKIFPPTPTP